MKEQFILNWAGNKYEEIKKNKKIYEHVDFDKYDIFVEPFCGSFGFIRYIYNVIGLKDKKFVVYDSDKKLIDFYNHLKNIDIEKFVDRYNETIDKIIDTEGLTFISKFGVITGFKKKIKDYLNENVNDIFMVYVLNKNLIWGSFCKLNYKKNMIFADLIKKTTFIHKTFLEVDFNKYNKDKTFIFFDPPYLGEYNDFYKDTDVLSLLEKIHKLMTQYGGSFIHIKNDLIDVMFGAFFSDSYIKLYNINHKIVEHNVFIS
jgi:site-specific DNA-adenine methylase